MKTDSLAFVVWLALLVMGSLLPLGGVGSVPQLMFWLGIPLVVPSIYMIANGVGVRELLSRLGLAAPWIIAAVLLLGLFGLALLSTYGLIFGSLSGAYIGIVMFCLWATYPPAKKSQ
jgi:hypothetical protein